MKFKNSPGPFSKMQGQVATLR